MKSKFLLTAILFASVLTAKAQINYGVRAGINISNQKMKVLGLSMNNTAKVGLNFGGFAEFGLNEKFSIQPELTFSSMGSKGTESELDVNWNEITTSVTYSLNYISIPLLVKYKVSDFSFGVGPQLGILASSKIKAMGRSVDNDDVFKGTDFSGILNADYTFADKILVGVRYQMGLSNIMKTTDESFGGKINNNAFQILIGYKF